MTIDFSRDGNPDLEIHQILHSRFTSLKIRYLKAFERQEEELLKALELIRKTSGSDEVFYKSMEDFSRNIYEPEEIDLFKEINAYSALYELVFQTGYSSQKETISRLGLINPLFGTELRNFMFTFDDIVQLDDQSVQKVLRKVMQNDLALAMKGAKEEVQNKIYSNMSQLGVNLLKENIYYLGAVPVSEVYNAQQKIASVVLALEESGEIALVFEGESFIE